MCEWKPISVEEASELLGCDMSKTMDYYGETVRCYDFSTNGRIVEYKYGIQEYEEEHPEEITVFQVDIITKEERHSGITAGCFFTDWELVH